MGRVNGGQEAADQRFRFNVTTYHTTRDCYIIFLDHLLEWESSSSYVSYKLSVSTRNKYNFIHGFGVSYYSCSQRMQNAAESLASQESPPLKYY